jgi:hypothetical protein
MPLSPLGERVAREGAFISRSGTGEGVRNAKNKSKVKRQKSKGKADALTEVIP